ncbi:RNA polymerase recycling motor HelD [Bacillus suaedaesalsae]|uniref:UvrD-helicase domain-containing protein n=1 Tax=Bacillus suaedaesalsae TaxID=2810349 RepID=A0ABS2DJX3_9BACI|nr:RNA polymerase recycling motor HelD [Bacillus suaedaesalsae]MBM6618797.1 UvrD-helicase domain-containing protein [Bacillus suaedaesalsae]
MSLSPQEWEKEQHRVNEVVVEVDKKINSMKYHLDSLKTDIVDIRKDFWEDVRVNTDEPHDLIETFVSIKQQAEFLSERERSHGHSHYLISKLKRLKRSPYFGRINYRFEGEQEENPIYLGIASFLNEDDEFLVYDWRAPISSLYYDSLPGKAEYRTPEGNVKGDLTLKRQYIIKNSEIKGMFDTGLAIGDELLQEVLGQNSDSQMKTIVATIQKEQNDIIRNETSKYLVVQGAAGSGKTSAALQRVAYLLYRYRETLEAEHILLFSPNSLFNDYISTVLPELGEKNMQQTTFQDFVERTLELDLNIEDPFTQMEYTLSQEKKPGYEARMKGIEFKTSKDFMELLDQYLQRLSETGLLFHDIEFSGRTIFTAEVVNKWFLELDSSSSIPNRLQLLTDQLLRELKRFARKERKAEWVEEEIQYLDKETYLKAYRKLQQKHKKQFSEDAFKDLALEQDFLSKVVVNSYLKPIRKYIRDMKYVDFLGMYEDVFKGSSCDNSNLWQELCNQTLQSIEEGTLFYEDAAPLLYLKEKLLGLYKNTSVKHVFIDEAQDYSELQLALLSILFPMSHMTLLGDFNQAIFAHSVNGYAALNEDVHIEKETITLTRSYRSTKQIVEFTKQLVLNGNEIEPFNRNGEKPHVTIVDYHTKLSPLTIITIQSLQNKGVHHIAVICKTAEESVEVYNQLREEVQVKLVQKESSTFDNGLVVIPSYLAKGIEFDAVILYNASTDVYGREYERKLFYTACTRAMHELFINVCGEMNPFLREVDPKLLDLQIID